jgi:uncharacterized protein (TIGR00296 family)
MDEETGRLLVRLARKAVRTYLEEKKLIEPEKSGPLSEKRGVFVSIYRYPNKELRGCIGYQTPVYPLGEATVRAAVAAAVDDPRFPPMSPDEMESTIFEVSVLTKPVEVAVEPRKSLPERVNVGVDGLVIETPYGSGLLLPQVPVEYGMDAEEFLTQLCMKAGLEPTYWLYGKMRLYKFSAEVFAEKKPMGEVVRVQLDGAKC